MRCYNNGQCYHKQNRVRVRVLLSIHVDWWLVISLGGKLSHGSSPGAFDRRRYSVRCGRPSTRLAVHFGRYVDVAAGRSLRLRSLWT